MQADYGVMLLRSWELNIMQRVINKRSNSQKVVLLGVNVEAGFDHSSGQVLREACQHNSFKNKTYLAFYIGCSCAMLADLAGSPRPHPAPSRGALYTIITALHTGG